MALESEKRRNEALLTIQRPEHKHAKARRTELAPLTAEEQQAVRTLAEDLPAVWDAPTTTAMDRKRLLRLQIQEVTVTVESTTPSTATLVVLLSGGATTSHSVACPPQGWHCSNDGRMVERLRVLAQHLPDHLIAPRLNAEGRRTQTGKD
ncbi:MAG: hypothetical protein EPO21_21485 [Chloroflexota bacterium]|nr:MAG: hypothetical protein EPO21_21485 [Chloroflexota bacterium]